MKSTEEKKLRTEKHAMRLSFAGSAAFVVAEFVSFFMTGSHTILMDCLFDGVDLVLIGPFLLLIPFLYKPETERHPYGYGQVESLFIVIKYGVLLTVCVTTIILNIRLILSGGHMVKAEDVASFEIIITLGCLLVYLFLRYFSNKYASEIIRSELYAWKLDIFSSLGIAAAFLLTWFLKGTKADFLIPYMDPVAAIALTLSLLVEPVRAIHRNLKELLLFSAPKEVVEEVRRIAEEELSKYSCDITFLEVIRTGRKTWIEIYINSESDLVSVKHLAMANRAIYERLRGRFDQYYIDIIPDSAADAAEAEKEDEKNGQTCHSMAAQR